MNHDEDVNGDILVRRERNTLPHDIRAKLFIILLEEFHDAQILHHLKFIQGRQSFRSHDVRKLCNGIFEWFDVLFSRNTDYLFKYVMTFSVLAKAVLLGCILRRFFVLSKL